MIFPEKYPKTIQIKYQEEDYIVVNIECHCDSKMIIKQPVSPDILIDGKLVYVCVRCGQKYLIPCIEMLIGDKKE